MLYPDAEEGCTLKDDDINFVEEAGLNGVPHSPGVSTQVLLSDFCKKEKFTYSHLPVSASENSASFIKPAVRLIFTLIMAL